MAGFPLNPPSTQLVDAQGRATPEFYRFLLAIQKTIGGPSDPFDDATAVAATLAAAMTSMEPDFLLFPPHTAEPGILTASTALTGGGSMARNISVALADTAVTPGSYGDSTHVASFTVDQQGRLTAAADVAISASGIGAVVTTGTPASGNLAKFSGAGSITGGDLSGDVTTSGTLATTLANSGATAGTYGDSTHVAQVTVDAKGRVTSASSVAIGGGALTLIEEYVGDGTAGTHTFSSLGSYRDLILVCQGQSSASATADTLAAIVNGDNAANYLTQSITYNNATIGTSGASNSEFDIGAFVGATGPANYPGSGELTILNYRNTVFHKRAHSHGAWSTSTATSAITGRIREMQWKNTAAITSLTVFLASGNFVAGSTLTLYGRG